MNREIVRALSKRFQLKNRLLTTRLSRSTLTMMATSRRWIMWSPLPDLNWGHPDVC